MKLPRIYSFTSPIRANTGKTEEDDFFNIKKDEIVFK